MGRMTASDYLSTARAAAGGVGDELPAARLLSWLNETVQDTCLRYRHPELDATASITTVQGTDSYTFAETDIFRLGSGRIDDQSNRVHEVGRDRYERLVRSNSGQAVPTRFVRTYTGDVTVGVVLWQVPSGAYTIEFPYSMRHPDLVTDGTPDSLYLNEVWDTIILDRLIATVLMRSGQRTEAMRHLQLAGVPAREKAAVKVSAAQNWDRGRARPRRISW